MQNILSFEAALTQVLEATVHAAQETVSFREAAERVLAEPVVADRDDPPAAKSAMDGYALRAADTSAAASGHAARFRYRHTIAAGTVPQETLPSASQPAPWLSTGEFPAVRIMTGALMPAGADAVVKQEHTQRSGDGTFLLRRPCNAGDNVIPQGARMQRGEVLLNAGVRLGPQALGILAAAHCPAVPVFRRPNVALLALGDELVEPEERLDAGKIPVTNLHVLDALMRRDGATCKNLGIAPDDPQRILALLEPCLDPTKAGAVGRTPCDLVLTLGGTRRGDFDFVHAVLERLEAKIRFDRVAMTPGGSTIFAQRGNTLFFGLPGTPAAAWSAFLTLVRPALRKRAGLSAPAQLRVPARLGIPIAATYDRVEFLPCRVESDADGLVAYPIRGRSTHEAPATQRADALLRLNPNSAGLAAGTTGFLEWVSD